MSAALDKGYEMIGSFFSRGGDTCWPLRLVGGFQKRASHNQVDLDATRQFASALGERFGDQRAAASRPTA